MMICGRERDLVVFDRYYTHEELTGWLTEKCAEYPDLVGMESIGSSHEGRDVWAVAVTDRRAGEPEGKPALYVDGNIHAGEVTASMTCLYLIEHLVSDASEDPRVDKILRTCTLYIIPRANPDGAEKYLTTPELLRSSVRVYPEYRRDEDPRGLHPADIDGDGRILLMRLEDGDRGAWKIDPQDSRLMTERTPADLEGPFYHVYTEGLIMDDRGEVADRVELPFEQVPVPYGLDLNRNFPAGYSPTAKGAGPFPLSEPESRNLVQFIDAHRNIGGALMYHTTGGVLFRPHSTLKDEEFDRDDMSIYESIGRWGTEVTGYPVVCCYGDIWSGVLDDWAWEHRGIYAFTPELWDVVGRAAPNMKVNPVRMRRMSSGERRDLELRLLQWNDRELAGAGFVPWRPFEHPQLGRVQLGGWVTKECRQNPPPSLLNAECHKNIQFPLLFALALPEVHIDEVEVSSLGGGCVISVLVSNHGYLDTCISKQAQKQKAVRQDVVEVVLPEGVQLLSGDRVTEIGFLEGYGRAQKPAYRRYSEQSRSAHRCKWTVRSEGAAEVTVIVRSERGGTVQRTVPLTAE
ncbi:MAG: M14 family metallopeptidase [Bacillota bacterium]